MAKEVTLEELAKSSNNNRMVTEPKTTTTEQSKPVNTIPSGIKTARPISTAELGKNLAAQHPEAQKKIIEEDAPLVANAFASMDATLAEKKRFYEEEVIPVVMENAREMAMEQEFGTADEEVSTSTVVDVDEDDFAELEEDEPIKKVSKDEGVYVAPSTPVIEPEKVEEKSAPVKTNKITQMPKKEESDDATLDSMMNDLGITEEAEDEIIDDEEETTEEVRERFKASLSNVKITRNNIDLSKFQIAKEPVSSAQILNTVGVNSKKRCDHPLIHTNRNMTFEECTGPELDSLNKTIRNSNALNGVIASLRFVYNHNIDANKPSFEAWCKSIRTEDVESLYFGMYKACYADTNLIARVDGDRENPDKNKKECFKTSLIDTPINDMIKFKDDDAKALFNSIHNQDTTNPENKIKSELMVISDDFAISYTDPTLYSTFIQYATLKPEITDKYSDYLNTMAYIDGFFKIDQVNSKLIPVAIKEYPNNLNKTVMSKLKTYIDILKTLSTDQYNIMVGKLENIIGTTKVSYIYPEATCPECGNTISEESVPSVLNLLFTRAQLVQVKSL